MVITRESAYHSKTVLLIRQLGRRMGVGMLMNKYTFAFACFCICLGALAGRSVPAQSPPNRYRLELQPQIESFIKQENIPGLAIAVVENNKLVYTQGFGVMSLANKGNGVSERTLFHVASTTKPFVATAIMQLVEK